jgi:Rps23 Pro-64 3,4-dihydroxylase Tpa1-like proline 4-hydroxylase
MDNAVADASPSTAEERVVRASGEAAATNAGDVEPAAYVQVCNFLTADLHAQILELALRNEPAFTASSVVTSDRDYRRSRVLFDLDECGTRMTAELRTILPWVYQRFGIVPSTDGRLELQMTAHNDGDFFKLHNDNGSPDTADRVVSYVYYCNRMPKGFSGGTLRLYDSRVENGYWVGAQTFHTVEPINNSIVFFLSRLLHEVSPIRCESRQFADSRITLNGWVRGI